VAPPADQVLHVIVGHGLPRLYLNTIVSFRNVLPDSPLLVIDNASPQADLRHRLSAMAAGDARMEVVLRPRNETGNGKVGGLYAAYRLAFQKAQERGSRYVHLLQADMQVLWWDDDALSRARALFALYPKCANIVTMALSGDRWLAGDLELDPATGHTVLTKYGLTDTGLYDLQRWAELGARWDSTEEEHAARALRQGMKVVLLPCPTEVQVPWPAVTRQGRQKGRELATSKPLLCRPLSDGELRRVKAAPVPVTLEEICTPWGWSCLSPMWNTDLGNVYYWALRRKDLAVHGWRRGSPRWVTRGLDHKYQVLWSPHRPSLVALVAGPLWALAKLRLPRARGRLMDRNARRPGLRAGPGAGARAGPG
jgi:hypothetical protein